MKVSGEDKKKSGHAMACAGSESYEWCGQILWAASHAIGRLVW